MLGSKMYSDREATGWNKMAPTKGREESHKSNPWI